MNSTYLESAPEESAPAIAALSDAELDAVSGGWLVGAAIFAAGFALGYAVTSAILD